MTPQPKHPSKRDRQKRINCWIPIALWLKVSELAEREGTDMTIEVVNALRHYFDSGKPKEQRVM